MSAEPRLSTRELIKAKSIFLSKARQFFYERGVIEVISPPLRKAPPTDLHLDHFVCQAFQDDEIFYMHSSPEYHMKQMLMEGVGDVFQVCQVARGNEYGSWHSKSFLMLEWYRLQMNTQKLMLEVYDLVKTLYDKNIPLIKYSYQQSYAQALGVPNIHSLNTDDLRGLCLQNGCGICDSWSENDCLDFLMTNVVEQQIDKIPLLIIYDYPASQAALAKTKTNANGDLVADRFEVYSFGIEIGNGYNELTCFKEHLSRFEADQSLRQANNKPIYAIDLDFVSDLKNKGMPNAAGIAMGFDRLFALALGAKHLLL